MSASESFQYDEFTEELQRLKPKELSALLDEGGALSRFFESYEARPMQLRLTEAITQCFNDYGIGVFEAGTGVGKSLAYLVPAMAQAAMVKKRLESVDEDSEAAGAGRIVISTATINLQQQIIEKDLPTARQILGLSEDDCPAVLLKGRSNYVCLRKLKNAVQDPELFPVSDDEETSLYAREADQLSAIQEWAKTTTDGSRASLPFVPLGRVWSQVCSESDDCRGIRCPHYVACFMMRAKRKAEQASLLVVNHHLLFADLALRYEDGNYTMNGVLPPFAHVVFDEAHAMTDAADSFFSAVFSYGALVRVTARLYRTKKRRITGLIQDISKYSAQADDKIDLFEKINRVIESAQVLNEHTLEAMGYRSSVGLFQMNPVVVGEILRRAEVFHDQLSEFNSAFAQLLSGIDDTSSCEEEFHQATVASRRLQAIEKNVATFIYETDDPKSIFWLEQRKMQTSEMVNFYRTPLSLAPILKSVFAPIASVVSTSATLQVSESFRFWLNQSGLDSIADRPPQTDVFGSPFLYRESVLLCIPNDAPFAGSSDYQDYVNTMVVKLIRAAKGRTLVLFTSYEALQKTAAYACEQLADDSISILRQGDDDRHRLLAQFKDDEQSCLFGTASFWEGVDVPGKALRQVIIPKLPFPVPDEPVFAARCRALESAGKNPFMNMSVPKAVVQWRQGFGRLMRHSDDFGAVVLLDRRVTAKSYGKIFLKSIPKTNECFEQSDKIVYTVSQFLGEK